jgi:hypothetical protein
LKHSKPVEVTFLTLPSPHCFTAAVAFTRTASVTEPSEDGTDVLQPANVTIASKLTDNNIFNTTTPSNSANHFSLVGRPLKR